MVSSLLLAGASGVLLASTSFSASRPDGVARIAIGDFPADGRYFTVACGFSHRNNDDPIVFPGEPGRSHNHTFFGNRSVDASSTPASLVAGPSSCDESDSSTYWTPTLYEGLDPITPLAAIVYYTRHTSAPVVAPPAGLKLVAGNAAAKRQQPKGIVFWSCAGRSKRFGSVPSCSEDSGLVFTARFPNCWNGKSTDSADHKRHMVYSARGACPASHPVRLPTITLVLIYAPTSRYARPSSGKFASHADFMNGWEQSVISRLVEGVNY